MTIPGTQEIGVGEIGAGDIESGFAATIQIHEMSALAGGIDKTYGAVLFKDADDATVDVNDVLVIPGSGSIYSYTKKLRAYLAVPPNELITNLRWYTDGGGFGTGVTVSVKNIGTTWGSNYKTEMADGSDIFGCTSGSPLDGDATDSGPFVPADDDSYIGDLIELQMAIDDTAIHGMLAPETITFSYDEV